MNISLWEFIKAAIESVTVDNVNFWLSELQSITGNLLESAFYIEKIGLLNSYFFTESTVRSAISALYLTTVGLLALKLCWKGYKVYILWTDGEAEASPFSLLKSSLYALAVALVFPILYDVATGFVMWLTGVIFRQFPGVSMGDYFILLGRFLGAVMASQIGGIAGILVLVFLIMAIVVVFQMLIRGVEMLIFRLGVPLAVIGLVDSDGGIWKSYIQLFFRQLATIMIQYFCMSMAILFVSDITIPSLIIGIVFLITAFRMPKLLSSLLSPSSGGGRGSQSMYAVMMAARTFIGGAG